MRDETKNTEVEVWMAEVFRYEDPDGELVEIAPPYRTIRSELHLGGEVTIGRSIGDPSRQGAGRIEISDSDQISRIALTLTEGHSPQPLISDNWTAHTSNNGAALVPG